MEPQVQTHRCENCGGTVKWNIRRQALACASCGADYIFPDQERWAVPENDYWTHRKPDPAQVSFPEREVITCSACGASVAFDSQDTAAVCPMCGSSQVMAAKQEAGFVPDGVVPFKIDKADAQQRFHKWIKSRWFAPNRLKQAYQQGKLDGVYIPFWTYDVDADARYYGQGGEEEEYEDSKGEKHTTIRWEPVSGNLTARYNDLAVCAAGGVVQEHIDKILPYQTEQNAVPYYSVYLSGYGAQRYAIDVEQGLDRATEQIEADMKDRASRAIRNRGYDTARVDRVELKYGQVGYKHLLLPVWTSAFSYNGKQYTYLINGESGKVAGDRPYSLAKIAAAAAAAVAAALILWSLLSGCAVPPQTQQPMDQGGQAQVQMEI